MVDIRVTYHKYKKCVYAVHVSLVRVARRMVNVGIYFYFECARMKPVMFFFRKKTAFLV